MLGALSSGLALWRLAADKPRTAKDFSSIASAGRYVPAVAMPIHPSRPSKTWSLRRRRPRLITDPDVVLWPGTRTAANGAETWTQHPRDARFIHIEIDPMPSLPLRLVDGDARLRWASSIASMTRRARSGTPRLRRSTAGSVRCGLAAARQPLFYPRDRLACRRRAQVYLAAWGREAAAINRADEHMNLGEAVVGHDRRLARSLARERAGVQPRPSDA